ncbi:MAG TPA: SAM-dependent methyltransferase, partial [Piscirickettsiaceae bacterium]|nr:SAM-dependent methyltransferase [Piscirickettsiaceae bacterium]
MNLPTPSSDEQARSNTLLQRIQNAIRQHGPMPFAEYMQRVLYTPNLGYYASGTPKLGAEGDFVTAPELTPLFGQCIARQIEQVLNSLNGGNILEFGAGSGKLTRDILLALAEVDALP